MQSWLRQWPLCLVYVRGEEMLYRDNNVEEDSQLVRIGVEVERMRGWKVVVFIDAQKYEEDVIEYLG